MSCSFFCLVFDTFRIYVNIICFIITLWFTLKHLNLSFIPNCCFAVWLLKSSLIPCDLTFFIYKMGITIFTLDGYLSHRSVCLGFNLYNKNIIKKINPETVCKTHLALCRYSTNTSFEFFFYPNTKNNNGNNSSDSFLIWKLRYMHFVNLWSNLHVTTFFFNNIV